MKNISAVCLCAVMVVCSPSLAFSHGGGLDGMGGHNNRKLGEYHFHRGPLAGQSFSSKAEAASALGSSATPDKSQPTAPTSESSANLQGVASVIDGDTVVIHNQRIRLHGIDAPESSQVCMVDGKPWRCGAEAANRLSEKIGKMPVVCEKRDTDRYGRQVSVCSLHGENLNAWMISEGLAVAYRKYSSDYVQQEAAAKEAKRGIWASKFDMPWDWRKARK